MSWEKFDEARKAANHATHVATQSSKNAHQLGTHAAHLSAMHDQAHASRMHNVAAGAARDIGNHAAVKEHRAAMDVHDTAARVHQTSSRAASKLENKAYSQATKGMKVLGGGNR